MLRLKKITKEYAIGGGSVHALKGISLDFREKEFVAILGPSGCGKTTLLNIVGGLDKYTEGDLVINGRSTKKYGDADWDVYRNHSIGFVFQSYNLVSHQSALANVELALKISGASKAERRAKAIAALERVGLGDQIDKKPNMMSGGQMQRVAIARALVNDPDIILADEPTGALDSETSIQVMDLLKEVAADRLVIMVTHNPDLADEYATRTIRLKDGLVVSDSNPVTEEELQDELPSKNPARTKLGFKTALGLSFNNLLTKKGRTILTSFAGAIGIIGIALILALSNGVNEYVSSIESDMMGSYPIELEKQAIDLESLMGSAQPALGEGSAEEHESDGIYSKNVVADSVVASEEMLKENDLGKFKAYLEENASSLDGFVSATEYGYGVTPQAYRLADDGNVIQVSPSALEQDESNATSTPMEGMGASGMPDAMSMGMSGSSSANSEWEQLASDQNLRESQYDLLAGDWPAASDEIALVVTEDNEVSDYSLYTLGLMDIDEMNEMVDAIKDGEEYDDPQERFEYQDAIGMEYQVFATSELYAKSDSGEAWINKTEDEDYLKSVFDKGLTVKVSCVLKAKDGAGITNGIGYDSRLTDYLMKTTSESEIVKEQINDPDTNVLTGTAFDAAADESTSQATGVEQGGAVNDAAASFDPAALAAQSGSSSGISSDQLAIMLAQASDTTPKTYEEVLDALEYVTADQPSTISMYPTDFEGKEKIEGLIDDYNSQTDKDTDKVTYTDLIGTLTSSLTTMIDTISYVLIAFVAISLIVSSIMIAIITYISVLERTKEIGILRAVGASKGSVTRIFTAETFIEGLISGVLGIVVALLVCIPINAVVSSLFGIDAIAALPLEYSIVLIAISVVLTLVAGFVPSRMAARKDPAVALRTE